MAKRIFSFALTSVLSCGIAFGAENYTTEAKEKITRNGINFYVESNSLLKERIQSGELDKALERMKKAYEANKNNKDSKAAAPAVSEVAIVAVCSQQQAGQLLNGCEDILDNQTSTNFNHGGNPFYVVTGVIGYGGRSTDSATFAGNQATMTDCIGIAGDDNIVFGWWEYWDITKPSNSNGDFVYTARSLNVGPTMSTSLYIK